MPGAPSIRPERSHGDPRGVQGDEEGRQPAVWPGIGVGAKDPEAPLGVRAALGAGRLTAQAPAAPLGTAGGAGAGRGRATAPASDQARHQISSPGGDRGQEALLLGRRADVEQGRAEEEEAVLAHPLGPAGPLVLLLENEPFHDPEAPAAVLRGPTHGGPPVGEHERFPGSMGFETSCGARRRAGAREGHGPPATHGPRAERPRAPRRRSRPCVCESGTPKGGLPGWSPEPPACPDATRNVPATSSCVGGCRQMEG